MAILWNFKSLCHRKWLMLFSLKLQRDNRQNALAVSPAKGEAGKRLYFHRTVEMKQPHAITELKRTHQPFPHETAFSLQGEKQWE
ncbi:hypothetical protein [uncultured Bilophila sp.]|uniref:hypothetical protein n=1 Tax=uncultured Bilophila sp. TaxID=529385 RepID=UPI00266ED196|nr:hypothetical protein [uncultured Bilophila sp.]